MGRPSTNGAPAFRFLPAEVAVMENILEEYKNALPDREFLVALAQQFSDSPYRKGNSVVQMKQVWNWFQNRRAAIRAKLNRGPAKLSISPMIRDESTLSRIVSHPISAPTPTPMPVTGPVSVPNPSGRIALDSCCWEFEAKSPKDGAWYDVASFLSHRFSETGDPELLVRFAGFGVEEDEWVNIRKHVRQRSSPCEPSECGLILPGDLVLCFQEGKKQALYYDAHVIDVQRRAHDYRGCRCRFLVRYGHDEIEEVVQLRKICRRPETDYRLQQLPTTSDQNNSSVYPSMERASRLINSNALTMQNQKNINAVVTAVATASNISGTSESNSLELKAAGSSSSRSAGFSKDAPVKSDAVTIAFYGNPSENV